MHLFSKLYASIIKQKLNIYSCFLLFIGFINNTHSQNNSSIEKKIFETYHDSVPYFYDLLHAVNYDQEAHDTGENEIKNFIEELKKKNLLKKTLKKQIQTIYKATHSKFLIKYSENAFFNDIFKNGNYNCVSASALYAIILDEFKINYSIRETPTHVYLIADTLGLQTLMESTLPGSGILSFSDKYKKDFISYLNENKIITETEYQNSSTETLFNEHYTKDKSINKYELAALQYYNKGIFLFNEKKYSGAALNLKKALTIYPSNNIKFMHFASLQNALINDINNKAYNGKLFGQVVNSSIKDESLLELSQNYFNDVSRDLCITSPDVARYKNFFKDMLLTCPKEEVSKFILSQYHYFLAYNYSITANYTKALSEIKLAYKYDNSNLLIKDLANNIGVKYFFIENNYKDQIDNMERYFEELPFLIKNSMYQSQYTYYYMKVISNAFKYDSPKEGIEYYKRFLSAVTKYDLIHYNQEHISIGFVSAAYYYASKNNFNKAIEIIDTGLDLVPLSNLLNKTKKDVKLGRQYSQSKQNHQRETTSNASKYISPSEKLKEKLYKYFPGNWKAESIIIEDTEQKLTEKETFELIASKNKNCVYIHDGKTEKGKWAYRPVSQCIYFVPNNNKDNYKVFKLKEVSSNKLVLLPYKDQKAPSPYKYILRLKD